MTNISPDYIVYTDGGARGNPGPAGAGVYITDSKGKPVREASKFLGETTNNVAEYQALVLALETLKKIISKNKRKETHIEVRMDSELIVKQLTGAYQIKQEKLFPLFIAVWNMRVAEFPSISFVHVPREENKDADRLANEAMDNNEATGYRR